MNRNTDSTVLLAWIERQGWIATFTEHGIAISYPITCERGARLLDELTLLTADQPVERVPPERRRRTRTGASS